MSTEQCDRVGQDRLAVETDFQNNVTPTPGGDADCRDTDCPLPRGKRRRRRSKADRGLPPDSDLASLATLYLERQRRLWPNLAEAGVLPEPSAGLIREMVTDFKHRHRTGKVNLEAVQPFARLVPKLGGNYDRYSCDNSSPTSILDQMARALEKAKTENRFIVWAYIFCDYSVSGLDASRQGYTSLKKVLSDPTHLIETTYVDDFTRAGRDEIEWWKLAALSKRHNKRLIGASDGFDLSNPNSEMYITVFGLVSRLFIKGLREKVRRGMRGAARRGTCLGKLRLGFTRKVHHDAQGKVVYRPDGRPRHQPCIDPETQKYRSMMFELFSVKRWSPYQIARHFNHLKIEGWEGWTESGIKKALVGLDAMGIFIWNRTRREYDADLDKMVILDNPRSEWEVYIDPKLRLVPVPWWIDARRRLRKVWDKRPSNRPKPSRNQMSATTLFSGTLVCGYCEGEITLIRSTEKYKQMGCSNGIQHAHGCKLSTSKSVRIIEECLLNFIRDHLFTEPVVEVVLANANDYFEQEAAKPQVDTAPFKAEARKLATNIRKYQRFIEDEPDEALCRSHNARVKELQARLNIVQAKIREAERQNRKPPKPLNLDRSKAYVPELRELLNQDISMAAASLRTLTGPITVHEEKVSGRRGARWIATFSPDLLALLRKVAGDKGYADASSLAAASVNAEEVQLVIEKVPEYELLGPKFKEMNDNGVSVLSIAHLHKMSWDYANEILQFARTGVRPKWKAGKPTGTGGNRRQYTEIAMEVVRLRDEEQMSFAKIAVRLGVHEGTIRRAYDHGNPDAVRVAAETGQTPQRGHYCHLGREKYQRIRELIAQGKKTPFIAKKVGCGTSTVDRVRQALKNQTDDDQAA